MVAELKVAKAGRYPIGKASELLGVDRSTVRRWIEAGTLRCGYHRHNKRRFVTGEELIRFFNASAI